MTGIFEPPQQTRPTGRRAPVMGNLLDQLLARSPELRQAILNLEKALAMEESLEPSLAEFAFLRSSVLNGCAACVRRHTSSARKQGLTEGVLARLLDEECDDALDEKERAVLLLVDTLAASPRDFDQGVIDIVGTHLDADQIAGLVLVIAAASALNRVVLASSRLAATPKPIGTRTFSNCPGPDEDRINKEGDRA